MTTVPQTTVVTQMGSRRWPLMAAGTTDTFRG